MNARIFVCTVAHHDCRFLAAMLRSFEAIPDRFVFVSELPWSGEPGHWQRTIEIAEASGATARSR